MIKLTLTLLLLFTFSSCGSLNIEKRKHTKGFYLSSLKRTNPKAEKTITTTLSEDVDRVEISSFAIAEEKILMPITIDSTNRDKGKFCDTIVLRNGATLSVHILEKNDSTLMYSLCEGDDDSEITIPLENVKLIKYKEGKFDALNQKDETSKTIKTKYVKPKKEENILVYILGTFMGSIGIIILAAFLLILAAIGTDGILFPFLVFLIVAFSFYLFLQLIFRNREKPKFLLFYALLFGIPFGIIAYFIF